MKNPFKIIRNEFFYLLARFLYIFSKIVPWQLSQKLGGFLGTAAYYSIKKKYRFITAGNIKRVFKEKSQKDIRSFTLNVFKNQGKNLLELLQTPKLNSANIRNFVKISGTENLESALKKNRGVLYLTAHIGNWELMSIAVSLYGYKVNLVSTNIDEFEPMLLSMREPKGVHTIFRRNKDVLREILSALKKNEIVGITIDQKINLVPGIYVDFFNSKVLTAVGLAVIALKTSASIVPGFITRQKDGTHLIELLPEPELIRTGNYQEDIRQNTQKFTNIIETHIRKYPEQWVWFHERWG